MMGELPKSVDGLRRRRQRPWMRPPPMRASNKSRPCRLGLRCPAPVSTLPSGRKFITCIPLPDAARPASTYTCRFYRVRPDGGKRTCRRRNVSSPSCRRTVPRDWGDARSGAAFVLTAIEHPNMVFWRDIHVVRGGPRTRHVRPCIHPMTGVECLVHARRRLRSWRRDQSGRGLEGYSRFHLCVHPIPPD